MTQLAHPKMETKRIHVPIDTLETDGTFSGYASLFGKVDLGKDRVEKGAFVKSLKTRGTKGIRMLFQHDPSEPIGSWQVVREDAQGLFVKGRIASTSTKGADVLNLMREGAIDGLSIGFKTEKSTTDRATGVRSITEADLWEISVVTFPMLPTARVETVKSASGEPLRTLPTIRSFERWLTRDAGLSRKEARTVIAKGYSALHGKRELAPPKAAQLADRIRQATALIKR